LTTEIAYTTQPHRVNVNGIKNASKLDDPAGAAWKRHGYEKSSLNFVDATE
jgi:hypothetical protein